MEHAVIRHERRCGLLGSEIRTRMIQLDLSQDDLARKAGISAAVIGDMATGKPRNYRPNTLVAVAAGLDWHPMAPMAVLASDEAAASVGIHLPSHGSSPDEPTGGQPHLAPAA